MSRNPRSPLYFAYGSNMNHKQMQRRCPGAVCLGGCELPGHVIAFQDYSATWAGGVANVVPCDNGAVMGMVWRLSKSSLHKLDGYEGFPVVYDRALMPVFATTTGEKHQAWVYYKDPHTPWYPPVDDYFDLIYRVYLKQRFDLKPLFGAFAKAKRLADDMDL